MDPRSLLALDVHLVVTVRPTEPLTPRQQKEWIRNAKRTLVVVSSRYGDLYRNDAYATWLYGQLRELREPRPLSDDAAPPKRN